MLTHCFFIVYIYCGWLFFISLLLVSVLLAIFSFLIFRMLYHLLWVLLSQLLLNYLTILLLFLFNIRFKRDGRIYFLYLISWVICSFSLYLIMTSVSEIGFFKRYWMRFIFNDLRFVYICELSPLTLIIQVIIMIL